VFNGLDGDGGAGGTFEATIRASFLDLPENPTSEQVEAWVDLVMLIQDGDFAARVRVMAERGAAKHVSEAATARHQETFNAVLAARAAQAYAEGTDPVSASGIAVATAIAASYASATGAADTPAWRAGLIDDLETFTDRRVYRFWELVAAVGGNQPMPTAAGPSIESMEWLLAALRAAT
jgi:hypothetical protein